ncbi:TetR/AcrR family transcriptional regulator [Halobellus salinisoli]|uniref:TetR/AcrR family transcriptional regulator n=1 Tax=Halobellus salinisoli TaxID=3108500 RepID=UPI00300B57FB
MTEDTAVEILHATHDALCTHGYADVTMQDIADEVDLCKASIHYHYDGKHDLLLAYLDHLYDRFTDRLSGTEGYPAEERLYMLVDTFISDREDEQAFQTALLEIKAQSPYDSAFRDRLERFDESFSNAIGDIVEEGIESGRFDDDVDPDAVASFLTTFVNGVQTRHVGVGHPPEESADALKEYIAETLCAGDVAPDNIELGAEAAGVGSATE